MNVSGPLRTPALYDLSREQLADLMASEPSYRVDQVWDGLYGHARRPTEITNIPLALRERLASETTVSLGEPTTREADGGQTVKWAWTLHDGARIETVLMLYPDRATVCVSSQAGCAMACQFCATGQAGFSRHLSVGEIVEQVIVAVRAAAPRRVTNVVFMGMGEPLANYDRTWSALRRIHGDIGISARHLTVSTVGLVPGIRRMSEEDLPVNLAVSLHAADDELRDRLVPINKRYPLAMLAESCATYVERTGRRLSFEWALIADVNDRPVDAQRLAGLAFDLRAHVNVIPLNPTPGYPVRGTSAQGVADFCHELRHLGVNVTVRDTRGSDIDAACGQLAASISLGTD